MLEEELGGMLRRVGRRRGVLEVAAPSSAFGANRQGMNRLRAHKLAFFRRGESPKDDFLRGG
jgi:hypothetical protein